MTNPVAVFDCMVYLQAAARAQGPARACLRLAEEGRLRLVISPATRSELQDVLNRPKVRGKFRSVTDEAVAVFLGDIDRVTTSVGAVPTVVVLPRDPKVEPYLNLAVAVGARYLVTWDKDLLDLMKDTPDGKDFRSRFP